MHFLIIFGVTTLAGERRRANRGISWPDQFSGFLSDVGTGSRSPPSSYTFYSMYVGPLPPNFPLFRSSKTLFLSSSLPSFSFLAGLVMDDESLRRGPQGWRGNKCRTENQRFFIDFVIIFLLNCGTMSTASCSIFVSWTDEIPCQVWRKPHSAITRRLLFSDRHRRCAPHRRTYILLFDRPKKKIGKRVSKNYTAAAIAFLLGGARRRSVACFHLLKLRFLLQKSTQNNFYLTKATYLFAIWTRMKGKLCHPHRFPIYCAASTDI